MSRCRRITWRAWRVTKGCWATAADETVLTAPLFPPLIHCGNRDRQVAGRARSYPRRPGRVCFRCIPLSRRGLRGAARARSRLHGRRTTARNTWPLASVLVAAVVLAILAGLAVRLLRSLAAVVAGRHQQAVRSTTTRSHRLQRSRRCAKCANCSMNWKRSNGSKMNSTRTGHPRRYDHGSRRSARRFAHAGGFRTASRTSTGAPRRQPRCAGARSGMVTAIDRWCGACSGAWIAHGSGSADRQVVDAGHVASSPEDPTYSCAACGSRPREGRGLLLTSPTKVSGPLCHLAYVRPACRGATGRDRAIAGVPPRCRDRRSTAPDPVRVVQDFRASRCSRS